MFKVMHFKEFSCHITLIQYVVYLQLTAQLEEQPRIQQEPKSLCSALKTDWVCY